MSLTVLIVIRDRTIADKYRAIIEELRWQVVGPAGTVCEALTLLAIEEPSVAILDLKFRDERVTPVAEELLRRKIPFILASKSLNPVKKGGSSAFVGVGNLRRDPTVRTIARDLTLLTEGF